MGVHYTLQNMVIRNKETFQGMFKNHTIFITVRHCCHSLWTVPHHYLMDADWVWMWYRAVSISGLYSLVPVPWWPCENTSPEPRSIHLGLYQKIRDWHLTYSLEPRPADSSLQLPAEPTLRQPNISWLTDLYTQKNRFLWLWAMMLVLCPVILGFIYLRNSS